MAKPDPTPLPEAILAHRRFVQELVRSLLQRGSDADDVVQETLVRAWQGDGNRQGRLRAWLARIARNLAIDHGRAAQRRARKAIAAAATPENVPTPAEVLIREEQRQRGARVEGVVRDAATGLPIAGVRVELVRDYRAAAAPPAAPTGADGRFAIDDVPAGEQHLVLRADGYLAAVFGPFEAASEAGPQFVEPTLARGVRVRGRVVGQLPAAGLRIRISDEAGHDSEAEVSADLAFEVVNAPPGGNRITLLSANGRRHSRMVTVPAGGLDALELPLPSGTGTIRVELRGGPERGTLAAARDGTDGEDRVPFTGGAATIDSLRPGRYRLTARSDDGAELGSAEADVGDGEVAVPIDCRGGR